MTITLADFLAEPIAVIQNKSLKSLFIQDCLKAIVGPIFKKTWDPEDAANYRPG